MSTWVALTPRDTLIVRDGRQFDAGVDVVAETVLPRPATVAGAVFTAYGRQRDPDRLRGPVLGVKGRRGWSTAFPTPADLTAEGNRLRSFDDGVRTDFDGLAGPGRWLGGEDETGRGWVSGHTLAAYLAGEGLDKSATGPAPFVPETRVGLARKDGVARTGLLYQSTHLRMQEGWALLVDCDLAPDWAATLTGPVQLGGRGRLVDVAEATGVDWPAAPSAFPGGRVLVYLATPAIWPGGWQLPIPASARLAAAAVGEPEPIAAASPGPDFANSRRLHWAVPAGSVYLLTFDDPHAAQEWAEAAHGRAYPEPSTAETDADRLVTAGFGVVLTGVWQ